MHLIERAHGRVVWPIRKRRRAAAAAAVVKPAIWRGPAVVSFAFDDIPQTAWTVGGAILEAHGARGTYYVSAGLAGARENGLPCHTWTDLAALAARGHELACHTHDHVSPLRTSMPAFARSLDRNAHALAPLLGARSLRNFAYAYGEASIPAKRLCARRFRSARGVEWGLNVGLVDLAQLKAVGLEVSTGARLDARAALRDAIARQGWLIFYTHDVSDAPSPWGCTPEFLADLVSETRRAGAPILTVDEALDRGGLCL